jgi:putative oxygen-independent coproporphyrinogen III oxidase
MGFGTRTPAGPPIALYVHVPFCLSVCPYCDFAVHAGRDARRSSGRIRDLVDALGMELELRADAADEQFGPRSARPALRSVYFGGGTPSLLTPDEVGGLLERLGRRFGLAPDAEITLEANPGAADRGDLRGFRAAGVTRLSLGAQSFQDAELRSLGRRHVALDVVAAMGEARAVGFASVSLDLLYDVPGQTPASWRATLERALELAPDHLSTYALTLEHRTGEPSPAAGDDRVPARPGALAWRRRAAAVQDDDAAAAMDALADEILEPAGFWRYEIANRARPGHASRHNLTYWQGGAYEGVGPGAHAFDGAHLRRWNGASLSGYLSALLPEQRAGVNPGLPPGGHEVLDAATARAERLILGLRLAEGVDAEAATDASHRPALDWARSAGLLERAGARLKLTARGRLLSNELFMRLLPAPV